LKVHIERLGAEAVVPRQLNRALLQIHPAIMAKRRVRLKTVCKNRDAKSGRIRDRAAGSAVRDPR
jgi:hypothetical protein